LYFSSHRNRLVEKKIPGKDWEYIVYDNLDRPVLTQDANQRVPSTNEWLFTKYDALGRVIYTGIHDDINNRSRASMQSHFNSQNNVASKYYESKATSGTGYDNTYYTNANFPDSSLEVLTVNYYDNYTFNRGAGIGTSVSTIYGVNSTTNTKGLPTGSKVKILGETNWITTISYYDEKARSIYVYSYNDYLKTTDIVNSKLNSFTGRLEETTTTHTNTNSALSTFSITDVFDYDHAGRLLTQRQTAGTHAQEVIVDNTYDELGQLIIKKVGGTNTQAGLQTVDYKYNVRGWLKNINQDSNPDNDLFNFTLRYNNPTTGTDLFNGNISQTSWNTLNTDSSTKTYTYSYDALNRITSGIDNTGKYNLNSITYDKNGNIETLVRKGHIVENPVTSNGAHFNTMDNLTYSYQPNSNKLLIVSDAIVTPASVKGEFKDDDNNTTPDTTNDYTYDVNGNMETDTNKGITGITYNHLNLPTSVTMAAGTINYVYDATGVKLRKVVSGNTTDYAGNYIYKNNTLEFFNQPEGYFNVTSTSGNLSGSYVYQYKDHLGNIRLSYTDNNKDGVINTSTEIIEESNYYPFGLKHKGYNNVTNPNGNSTAQKWGYADKKMDDDLSLNLIDFGARMYDPAIGRWNTTDPLSEEYFNYSPYVYVQNSPIQIIDPNGMEIVIIGDKNYVNKVLKHLTNLGSSSKRGAKLIMDAIKSKKQFVIFNPKEGDEGSVGDIDSETEGYETFGLNFSDAEEDLTGGNGGENKSTISSTVETTLAHELSHFNNPDNSPTPIGRSRSRQDEAEAIKDENQVRREMGGMPLRYYHGGNNVYGQKFENGRLTKDKDYSIDRPGIGKKSFHILFQHKTNRNSQDLNRDVYHLNTAIRKVLKGPTPKKQLSITVKK
jgi:RHS repeat-associated protein